jgi:tetratricopeptide (TPR) repeat protein
MAHSLEVLPQEVSAFCDSYLDAYDACIEDPVAAKDITAAALAELAVKFTTADYDFNYAMEIFVERYCDDIAPVLPEIVNDNLPARNSRRTKKTDLAFSAYYAQSLICKKEHDLNGLKALLGERYAPLHNLYPLSYEVKSRYHKRCGDYDEALECDDYAITILEGNGITNYGLCISYASTVCMMFDMGFEVTKDRAKRAAKYIETAIRYNPEYPKYHFLKGKLLYYANRSHPDPKVFDKAAQAAIDSIKTALQALFSKGGVHVDSERKTYSALIRQIQRERNHRMEETMSLFTFKDMLPSEVKTAKEKVLQAERAKDCLPMRPNLKPGDKYFFVCYCTEDFKSVFCDLIEMYSRKIPFIYDESLMHGVDWLSQVRSYISSEDCVGVIFYISRHTVTSGALEKEIRLVVHDFKDHRPYFCVNLEGDTPPSQILIEAIQENTSELLQKCGVDGNRICCFLQAFTDDGVFTPKYPQDGADSSSHFCDLLPAITKKFPSICLAAGAENDLFSPV